MLTKNLNKQKILIIRQQLRWLKCNQLSNNFKSRTKHEIFKQEEFQRVINTYTECIQELNYKQSLNEQELEQLVIIYSNRVQCQLKQINYNQALQDIKKALSLNSNHQKSLLKRSTALQKLRRWKEALKERRYQSRDQNELFK